MLITVKNEAPFQILSGAFTIGPSPTGYVLQVGATPDSFTSLFNVGANIPRMVTNVANGSYYRLKNNSGDVKVNWERTCDSGGSGGGGNAGELEPVTEFPLSPIEGTVVALASGDTVGLYQFIDDEWVLVGADDPTKLAPVAELPASAETGTVVALYQEGEAGGGTWKLSQDGSYYYFDCDFSTLDQTQEYPLGLPFDMYQPSRTWDGDFILYYNNGWRIKNGYEVDDGEEPVHYDVDSLLSSVRYSGEFECGSATGDPDNPYIGMSFEWNNVTEQLEVRSNGHNFNDPGMCQPDLKNIAGEAGEPILGLYQYDGQNWNEVGGGIDELVEMLQAKEEVIASAITELHEALPDMSNYWTSGQTKSYVDGAVGALATELASVEDDLNDIERVTATALTELHDSILDLSGATADFVTSGDVASQITAATEDFVTTADTQEIIDRLQTVETVASSAFDYLETMMETKEEVIAEALTDLEDTKVGSEDIKRIVKLTQAEYDLIATPDPETLYIIVNA